MITASILRENKAYWTIRAPGYSEVNRLELQGDQRERWKSCLAEELSRHFKGRALTDLHILEAGTGPGFFAILLAELGARVTAIDLTPAMLREALENAGPHAGTITFLEMDAQALAFADASFDAVISRNLTWNLPAPAKALAEWTRVLKPGGLLLNFDANWYAYLFDENARAAYEQDRLNTKVSGVPDQNIGERFDVMEALAFKMPLSPLARPAWDLAVLTSLGLSPEADCGVWQRVWSDEEKLNFASTPLFLVRAKKISPPVAIRRRIRYFKDSNRFSCRRRYYYGKTRLLQRKIRSPRGDDRPDERPRMLVRRRRLRCGALPQLSHFRNG